MDSQESKEKTEVVEELLIEDEDSTTLEYSEYQESLLKFSNLTTKENSILINFDITSSTVKNSVKTIQQNGHQEKLKDSEFEFDNLFKSDLLEPFIFNFAKNPNNKVVITDLGEDAKLNKFNYRMITENNDMVTINGLDKDYANYIADEVTKITYNSKDKEKVVLVKEMNQQGKSNTLVIILTIILISITLVGTIYFTIVANS